MWSGITRFGRRCASQSSTRASWRASRKVFSLGASVSVMSGSLLTVG